MQGSGPSCFSQFGSRSRASLAIFVKKITLQVLKKTKKRDQNFETFTSSFRALCCFNIVLTEIQSEDTVAGIRIQLEISLRVFKFKDRMLISNGASLIRASTTASERLRNSLL